MQRIIEPMIFHKTINFKRYVRLVLSPFSNQLTEEKLYWHFMPILWLH
jgi:hypothetical protein